MQITAWEFVVTVFKLAAPFTCLISIGFLIMGMKEHKTLMNKMKQGEPIPPNNGKRGGIVRKKRRVD